MGLTAAELELRKRRLGLDGDEELRMSELGDLIAGRSGGGAGSPGLPAGGPYDLACAVERQRVAAAQDRDGVGIEPYLADCCASLVEVGERLAGASSDPQDAMRAFLSVLRLAFLDIGLAVDARVATRDRALQEATRELETFTYAVAHDLRAPLRAFIGFSEALMGTRRTAWTSGRGHTSGSSRRTAGGWASSSRSS